MSVEIPARAGRTPRANDTMRKTCMSSKGWAAAPGVQSKTEIREQLQSCHHEHLQGSHNGKWPVEESIAEPGECEMSIRQDPGG